MRLLLAIIAELSVLAMTLADDEKSATRREPPQSPVVHTNNGAVRGRVIFAANGRYAQEFLNIPYAQPPVDALRFRPPQPVKDWPGERDGTNLGKACVQNAGGLAKLFKDPRFRIDADPTTLNEDCLIINVYTPFPTQEKTNNMLPVLIWIHGGGFQWGANNAAIYNASILASEINAVVAVINYRVGPLGFFTLEDVDGVSGNQGLLDQALAVKWVRDNAKHFGGDAEKITLFGESAGSASVQYHTLSPVSRALFARSIMQSGTASNSWAYHTPAQARQASRTFAAAAGCKPDTASEKFADKETFECLKTKSVEDLMSAEVKLKKEGTNVKYLPTSDGVFLPKSPAEMLKAGDFKRSPAMIGTTANESMWLLSILFPELLAHLPDVSLSQETFDKMLLQITSSFGNATREAIKFMYRNWNAHVENNDEKASGKERWLMLNAVMDDLFVNNGMIETLDAYVAAKVPTFRYRFNHISAVSIWQFEYNAPVHVDDIPFFFGLPLNPEFSYPKEEVDLSRQILHSIGEFARTADPNEQSIESKGAADIRTWTPYTENMEYFTFDAGNFGKVQSGPERWRVEFWHRAVPYLSQLEAQKTDLSLVRATPTIVNPKTVGQKMEL